MFQLSVLLYGHLLRKRSPKMKWITEYTHYYGMFLTYNKIGASWILLVAGYALICPATYVGVKKLGLVQEN
jgi:hypothetical protein